MKSKICKSKVRKITQEITEKYDLFLENKAYGILCTEFNENENIIVHEEVKNITASKKEAKRMYKLLVDNGACVGTIKDIIDDQMC